MYTKNTVRLVVQFKDFNGKEIEVENVELTIYDLKQEILEEITEGITKKDNEYYYDFEAPEHDFIFEFKGFYFDKPILARQKVKVKFN